MESDESTNRAAFAEGLKIQGITSFNTNFSVSAMKDALGHFRLPQDDIDNKQNSYAYTLVCSALDISGAITNPTVQRLSSDVTNKFIDAQFSVFGGNFKKGGISTGSALIKAKNGGVSG